MLESAKAEELAEVEGVKAFPRTNEADELSVAGGSEALPEAEDADMLPVASDATLVKECNPRDRVSRFMIPRDVPITQQIKNRASLTSIMWLVGASLEMFDNFTLVPPAGL